MKQIKKLICVLMVIFLGISFSGCDKGCQLEPKSGFTIVGDGADCYYTNGTNNYSGDDITSQAGLKINNICIYPFAIYIDGTYQTTLSGGGNYTYFSNTYGTHTVKIEQRSGFYEYPFIDQFTKTIYTGEISAINIPSVTIGKIKLVSESENPYTIYIDDANKGTINANSEQTFTVDAWHSYKVRVEQQSGYVFYPSKYEWTVNVDASYIYTRIFPIS